MPAIDQVFPVKKQAPLEGLYLDQRLQERAAALGRSLVLTNYVTDRNGVVAKADRDGHFKVPGEIKNDSDWGRFQELMAQADVIISGGSYFKRLAKGAQDVLYPFEAGNPFEKLGEWRLRAGHTQRSPDIAVVTRRLDFDLPDELRGSGRKILIFTTDSMARSDKAADLQDANTLVLGSGATGVDGGRMIAALQDMRYRVVMMVSGPAVLELLLAASRLDLLYLTQVHVEIPFDDPERVEILQPRGKKIDELEDFVLAHQFVQTNVRTEAGALVSQSFLRYDRKDLPVVE